MVRIRGKPLSAFGLLAVGLILVIEPTLPWYHFSPFWFSLGAASLALALYDLVRKPQAREETARSGPSSNS
jgi:hypothetical protein